MLDETSEDSCPARRQSAQGSDADKGEASPGSYPNSQVIQVRQVAGFTHSQIQALRIGFFDWLNVFAGFACAVEIGLEWWVRPSLALSALQESFSIHLTTCA
jgi:hypothetical protein